MRVSLSLTVIPNCAIMSRNYGTDLDFVALPIFMGDDDPGYLSFTVTSTDSGNVKAFRSY